jgi:hypothetical protein
VIGALEEGAAELLPLKPSQCLLVAAEDIFMVRSTYFWIDNLYLAITFIQPKKGVSREDWFPAGIGFPRLNSDPRNLKRMFVTNITVQGDGLGPAVGIGLDGVSAYIEGKHEH